MQKAFFSLQFKIDFLGILSMVRADNYKNNWLDGAYNKIIPEPTGLYRNPEINCVSSPELIRKSWFDDEVEKYYVNKIENSNCVCTQNANDILELLCWNSNSIWLTLEVCFEEWRAVPEEEEERHWVVWRQKPRGWVARSLKVGPLGIWSWNLCSGFDFAWLLFFWFPTNQSGSNFFYSLH